MKLYQSILLLSMVAKRGKAVYCGCDSCTQEVWDTLATNSDGSFTCGSRINWLQTVLGYDEASACATVSDEFIDGPCGPVCDPSKCSPPTLAPTQPPIPKATYCGCDSCTQEVWDTLATNSDGSFTCGGRINWLQTALGYDEASACAKVSDEFIDGPCGPLCDPSKCGSHPSFPSKSPTPLPTQTPTVEPSQAPTNTPSQAPSRKLTDDPTTAPSKELTLAPITSSPTKGPSPSLIEPGVSYCGCEACTQAVWDSVATDANGSYTCGSRIDWLQDTGYSEHDACAKVSSEFIDGPCGPACGCNSILPTLPPTTAKGPTDQKCGGAVDFTNDPNQACQTYLWSPTGDSTMHCFAYGGTSDPCHLNNNNDQDDGIFKDPSLCLSDTFYLWDEPDTQGRDYSWAGSTWLDYSKRFAQELEQLRSRGAKVTGPLLKAGSSGAIQQNMQTFFDACGTACFDPADPAYIDIIAINGFCGPWNGPAGCRGGAKFIYDEAVSVSGAFNDLPVYMTNWSRLQTSDSLEQVDAIDSIDEFFPASGVVERVYWFGARDYGGGAETTGYLNNVLQDGRSLGEVWRTKCDSI